LYQKANFLQKHEIAPFAMTFEDLPPETQDLLRQKAVCIKPLGLQTSDRVSGRGYIDIFMHDSQADYAHL
jgi:hypothetical protein